MSALIIVLAVLAGWVALSALAAVFFGRVVKIASRNDKSMRLAFQNR